MDQKSSRVFVRSVVTHLQKSIKSFDETKPEIIVATIEDHLKMIKMATDMKKPVLKKKKGGKKKKKGEEEEEEGGKKKTAADSLVAADVA